MKPGERNHDIVAIGASAGGIEPLKRLVSELPAALPASLFVVVHVGSASRLAEILDRVGPMRVAEAESGEPIEPGRAYVAPPGRHLLLHDGHVLLRRGPRENMSRPAVDPLFRSAACSFGARVIGVVLSGALNDGTAGLAAIKSCGGLAVVQEPADAAVPDMPLSALRHVAVDHRVPIDAMAALLRRLVAEPAGETPDIPVEIRLEAAIAAQELGDMAQEDRLGKPSRFTCPECNGTLWQVADDSMVRYRCHVGHAFTGDVLLAAQTGEVERLLWSLMRSHEERAVLARRMAGAERERVNGQLAEQLERRAQEYEEDAEVMRRLLKERNANAIPSGQEE